MSCLFKGLNIFLVILAMAGIAGAELPSVEVNIVGMGTRGPYELGYRNIINNSLSVYKKGNLMDPDLYEIVYVDGILWFVDAISVKDTIAVQFQYLPILLQNQYYLHEIRPANEPEVRPTESSRAAPRFANDISITGSKGFSIGGLVLQVFVW